jgi:DNA-binding LacI/PurR family transcriptional regulator
MAKRQVTIQAIASQLGVSTCTVSRVMNNTPGSGISAKTRERVLTEIDRLGYMPQYAASVLRSGRKHAWGVVVPSFDWLADFNRKIVSGIWEVAHERQQSLSIISMDNPNPQDYTRHIRQGRFDGIFVFYNGDTGEETVPFEDIQAQGIPVVVVNCRIRYEGIHNVYSDGRDGICQVVRHLIEAHGRRRIAFLGHERHHWILEDRYQGYLDAHRQTGLPIDPALTQDYIELGSYEKSSQGTVAALIERGVQFDAICTPMDYMAISVLGDLYDRGIRVPQDVSVTGFDDHHMCQAVRPKLTTVFSDAPAMGRQAARVMLDVLENTEDTSIRKFKIPTRLVVRQSCGCVAAGRE